MSERGRKGINKLIEIAILVEKEVSERGWETVDFVVEKFAKSETGESRRELVHRLVEVVPKGDVSEGRREVIHRLVKRFSETQYSNFTRQEVD